MSFSVEEFDQLQSKSHSVLAQLEQLDANEWVKKKDLIQEFILVNRTLLEYGKLDIGSKKEFCSYITAKLIERNITVNMNGSYYQLFNDDEKGNQNNRNIDQKSINISSGKTVDQEFKDKKIEKPKKNDKYTRHFTLLRENLKSAHELINSIEEKYNSKETIEKAIQEELKDIDSMIKDDLQTAVDFSLARKNVDARNEWGNYEKLVAQWLIKVGETKAELARKINYCAKYASIGIERNEELTSYWHFLGACPKCKTDVHDFFDRQIELQILGKDLEIDTPIKAY